MSQLVKPGKYPAHIRDYGISKTSKDKPQAFIIFDLGEGKSITWYGGLDPKSSDGLKKPTLEITVKTLLDCGFSGETIEIMAAGQSSNALEVGKEMELVIEDNFFEGNTSSRVKFINVPGFIGGPGRMTHEEVLGLGTSGALKAELLRQRKGVNTPKSPL